MKKTLLFACATVFCQCASAAAGYYLVPVYGDEGKTVIDYRYWTTAYSKSARASAPDIGVGYGVNSRWYTELYASYRHTEAQGTNFSGLNWQNDVLLTQGQYPFDLALHTNVEQYSGSGYGMEIGPAFQTNAGKTQFNANLFLQRDYRTGRTASTQMVYQLQVRQHWKPLLNYGVQGFGELGQWDDWAARDRQAYRIGPALFGDWRVGRGKDVKYEAAYLMGRTAENHTKSFSMRMQYAF